MDMSAAQETEFASEGSGDVNVVLAIAFASCLAWANAANDIANSVGTAVGAGAVSLRTALIIGSISEFAGCVLMGGEVAKTIGKGVVHAEQYSANHDFYAIAMTAVLAGAGISTMLATLFGLPVSATHGTISGLVAVAIFERGSAAIDGSTLAFTIFGWVASPLIGMMAAGLLSLWIEAQIFAKPDPHRAAQQMRPTLAAGTVGLVVSFLCMKGPKWLRMPWWAALIVACIAAGIIAVALKTRARTATTPDGLENGVTSLLGSLYGDNDAAVTATDGSAGAGSAGFTMEQSDEKHLKAEVLFTQLLVLTGCTVAFAHGGNDVGNSIGPLMGALQGSAQTSFVTRMQSPTLLSVCGGVLFVPYSGWI